MKQIPAKMIEFTALMASGTAKTYLATQLGNPEIQSSVRGEIGRAALTATISCSFAGVVT